MGRLTFPMAFAVLLFTSCGDNGTTAPVDTTPARLEAASGTSFEARVGETLELAVKATTSAGAPAEGVTVTFIVESGGGSVSRASVSTTANGMATTRWTLGTAVGDNRMRATTTGLPDVTFTATAAAGPPASFEPFAGMGQRAPAGTTLPYGIAGWLYDEYGNPTVGLTLSYTPSNGGVIHQGSETVDEDGFLWVRAWRLGPDVGQQRLVVGLGSDHEITFTATALAINSPFQPSIRYERESDFTAAQRSAIAAALLRVRAFMTATMPPARVELDEWKCEEIWLPAMNEVVRDPVIFVFLRDFETDPTFEGREQYAALGGVCGFRTYRDDPNHRTTLLGRVIVNSRASALTDSSGRLERLITHEFIHSLGFGKPWRAIVPSLRDFLQGSGSDDPRFTGETAVAAFGALERNQHGPVPVPVSPGDEGHWRGDLFMGEMMNRSPVEGLSGISTVTAGSLGDLGWPVDLALADPYPFFGPWDGGAAYDRGRAERVRRALERMRWDGPPPSPSLPAVPLVWDGVTGERINPDRAP